MQLRFTTAAHFLGNFAVPLSRSSKVVLTICAFCCFLVLYCIGRNAPTLLKIYLKMAIRLPPIGEIWRTSAICAAPLLITLLTSKLLS